MSNQPEIRLLLALMGAALQAQPNKLVAFDPACDTEALARMICRQSLAPMVCPVIQSQQDPAWQPLKQALKPVYERDIHRGMVQEYEFSALLEAMEAEGIDCLPMKGWIMRGYYPDPLMRSMSDLDLLVKEFDRARLEQWMQRRGYTLSEVEEGFHDGYQKPPHFYVELHRELIDPRHLLPAEKAWLLAQEPGFWAKSARMEGKEHLYRLSNEMFYLHHLSHFFKHFTNAGVGVRPLADLYLLLAKEGTKLDRTFLARQLEALHLTEFARRMERLCRVCFEKPEALTAQDQLLVGYLTGAGIYGSVQNQRTLRLMQRGKGSYLRSRLVETLRYGFLPLDGMKKIYPVLERRPWLLPVCWARRAMRVLFFEPFRLRQVAQAQSREQYDEMKGIFRAAGIE